MNTLLCSFETCPVKATCQNYRHKLTNWEKTNFLWWGSYPYEVRQGRCFKEKIITVNYSKALTNGTDNKE